MGAKVGLEVGFLVVGLAVGATVGRFCKQVEKGESAQSLLNRCDVFDAGWINKQSAYRRRERRRQLAMVMVMVIVVDVVDVISGVNGGPRRAWTKGHGLWS